MKFYLLLPILLLSMFDLNATHIVGGELRLEHINDINYRFVLNLFFDEINGSANARDPSVTIYIYSKKNNTRIAIYNGFFTSQTAIQYENDACNLGESLSTSILRYETPTLTFSEALYSDPEGYFAVWERCCRNNGIVNILAPQDASNAFLVEFPAIRRRDISGAWVPFVNSSPKFIDPQGDYLCLNRSSTLNFSATDKDGDILEYELVTPFNSNYSNRANPSPFLLNDINNSYTSYTLPPSPIIWSNAFSATNAIPGNPALQVNLTTGQITVRPNLTGLFVFSIRCREYRIIDGSRTQIGEVRRDFQLLVRTCLINNPPVSNIFLNKNPNTNSDPYQEGNLLELEAPKACLEVQVKDTTFEIITDISLVKISENVPFNTISLISRPVSLGATGTRTFNFCWPGCGSQNDIFEFYVIVKDGACPIPNRDSLRVKLFVKPEKDLPPFTELISASGNFSSTDNIFNVIVGQQLQANLISIEPDDKKLSLTVKGRNIDLNKIPAFNVFFNDFTAIKTDSSWIFNDIQNQVNTSISWLADCSFFNTYSPNTDYLIDIIAQEVTDTCKIDIDTFSVAFRVTEPETGLENFLPPNTFTPNKDGVNETFRLTNLPINNTAQNPNLPDENCQYQFLSIKIFNRWGKKVFESTSREFEWDALNYPTGVYYYFIDYKNISYKGNISVLK